MAMTQLTIGTDNRSIPIYALPMAGSTFYANIVAEVKTSLAVPVGAKYAVIGASNWYYVTLVPALSHVEPALGAGFGASLTEVNKPIVKFPGGADGTEVMTFRSGQPMRISVSFWS